MIEYTSSKERHGAQSLDYFHVCKDQEMILQDFCDWADEFCVFLGTRLNVDEIINQKTQHCLTYTSCYPKLDSCLLLLRELGLLECQSEPLTL